MGKQGQPKSSHPPCFPSVVAALFAFYTPVFHFSLRMGNKMLVEPGLPCF